MTKKNPGLTSFPKLAQLPRMLKSATLSKSQKANGKKLELSETEAEEGEYVSKSSRLNGLVKTDQL